MAKRYVREAGSADAVALITAPDATVHVGQLVRTELVSALARLVWEGVMARRDASALVSLYLGHERRLYHRVPVSEPIQRAAERLLFARRLRTVDALHVASALAIERVVSATGASFRFVTADSKQATAAEGEGLGVVLLG